MMKIVCESPHGYGRAASERIHLGALAYRGFLGRLGLDGDRLRTALGGMCEAIVQHAPTDLFEELFEVASGASISFEDIVLLNGRSELLSIWADWRGLECTSVAVSGKACVDGAARVAQNWDWLTVMRSLPIVLEARPKRGPAYVTFCEPGQLAKIGVNAVGLAVGLNFLEVPREEIALAKAGLPVHVLIRAALGEGSVEDAVEALRQLPRGGAACLALADAFGDACCVEIRPSRVDVLLAGDSGIVTHANDFEAGGRKAARSLRLQELLGKRAVTRDSLFGALCDHEGPEPICSHPHEMLSSSTLATAVLRTNPPTLSISSGPPCEGSLVEHKAVWSLA